MAKTQDKGGARSAKPGAKAAPKARSKPAARVAVSDLAQRRKDPVFMKHLEAAILDERARADASAVRGRTAAAKASVAAGAQATDRTAAKAGPRGAPKAKAAKAPPRNRVDADRKALAAELSGLIPELDAEGLAFLIEQARVHLYNMKVQDLEAAAEEAENASARAGKLASAKGGSSRAKSGVSSGSEDFTIHAAGNGSSYDLVWHDKWKMFTDEEMLAMVRITSSKDAVADVGGRLYRWFLAERRDVIADIPFSGLADPKLRKLVALLRKTFTVKSKK